jgi:hypothetical protein
MMMKKALFQFVVNLDIAESYLYGKAMGDVGTFAINIQGGSQQLILPRDLLADLPYANKARLHIIRKDSDATSTTIAPLTIDVRLSAGNDMIEIYGDDLLQKLANSTEVALQIEIK